jgi:SAM-dependent methyltransferase
MKTTADTYKPALRWNGLTRFYDRIMALTMQEDHFRTLLLDPIRALTPRYVLDVGCGTGTQAMWLRQMFPKASVGLANSAGARYVNGTALPGSNDGHCYL